MAALSAYCIKQVVDFIAGGATPTQPAARWAGLAAGTPTSISASELDNAVGYSRVTALFAPADSPGGFAALASSMWFGSFSSAATIIGFQLWNSSSGGDMLAYCALQTPRSVNVGDALLIPVGNLNITLG